MSTRQFQNLPRDVATLLQRLRTADDCEERTRLLRTLDDLICELQTRHIYTMDWMIRNQEDLESRLRGFENGMMSRFLASVLKFGDDQKKRLGQVLLRSPLHSLYVELTGAPEHRHYRSWAARRAAQLPSRERLLAQIEKWPRRPLISIVMPVHNPRRDWLDAAVNSVLAQAYRHWQLCVCDDASTGSWVAQYFEEHARLDSRIRFVRSTAPLGISGALNMALELSDGSYLAFLDHDDFLSLSALYHVVAALQQEDVDLLYSDEDQVDETGQAVRSLFKPDWSPDLLMTCMYLGHLMVVSRGALERVGKFRSEYDGAQDYDLALRLTDSSPRVTHVPQVLYHWRRHAGSSAKNTAAKPYTRAAGRCALEATVRRRGLDATVVDDQLPNKYSVHYRLKENIRVSLICSSGDGRGLARQIAAVRERTAYPELELLIVHRVSDDTRADQHIQRIAERYGALYVPYSGDRNPSAMNNEGARGASGDVLVFLGGEVTPLATQWLTALAGQLQRVEVGIVGGKLLYPNGMIYHAGISLGMMDAVGYPGRRLYRSNHWIWLDYTRNVTAVTAKCLAVRRPVFEDLGRFNRSFVLDYADVDLCLRARQEGYEVIIDDRVVMRYEGSRDASNSTCPEDRRLFLMRWFPVLSQTDPYYSPHLCRDKEDTSLSLQETAFGFSASEDSVDCFAYSRD